MELLTLGLSEISVLADPCLDQSASYLLWTALRPTACSDMALLSSSLISASVGCLPILLVAVFEGFDTATCLEPGEVLFPRSSLSASALAAHVAELV